MRRLGVRCRATTTWANALATTLVACTRERTQIVKPVPTGRNPPRTHKRVVTRCPAAHSGRRDGGAVIDDPVLQPDLTQPLLRLPIVEAVQRVVVLGLVFPRQALPVVLTPPAGRTTGGAEAKDAHATAHAKGKRDGEEACRGRLLVAWPPKQREELRVESRVDICKGVSEGARECLVLARADPRHMADADLQLWQTARRHHVGFLRIVHAPCRARAHGDLEPACRRRIDADHSIVRVDRSAEIGVAQRTR